MEGAFYCPFLALGNNKLKLFRGNHELILSTFWEKSTKWITTTQHAVIVHFQYGKTDLHPIFEIEDQLEAAIANAVVGEFDGNEIATDGSDGFLYMYGPDGDNLFAIVRPILEASEFLKGAIVKIRYGSPRSGAKEIELKIGG
ncbi:MAG: hypothetical protein MUP03_05235 [Anaerolineales bacterium]|nr:hypothetical protein [Anaerolineales bacterium]